MFFLFVVVVDGCDEGEKVFDCYFFVVGSVFW